MKNYSKRLIDVIEYSREEAARLQNSYIGPEHLMLGIIREGEGEAMRVLRELHTDPMDIKRKIEQEIKNTFDSEDSVQHEIAISKTTERVLRMSMLESRLFKEDETDTEHLLLAILKEEFNVAAKVLNDAGITYRSAYNILVSGTGLNNMEEFDEISDGYTDDDEDDEDEGFSSRREASRPSSGTGAGAAQPKSPNDTPVLDNFGTDMTRAAAENRLDPIVGREKEIERLAQILTRRKKNNPELIGEPGVGKSTMLLQLCGAISNQHTVLDITGHESVRQVKLRAARLKVPQDNIFLAAENDVDEICGLIEKEKPDLVVIDSIQTMRCMDISSSSGTVSQVKESAARLLAVAKKQEIPMFIVGHVNKDGAIAGPKVMEHIVDTVLYFEGDKMLPYRILRAAKNRYGSTNELGMFDMTGTGLAEIENPSQMLLEGRPLGVSGNCVACTMEGSRPILSEIQALATKTNFPAPRRACSGYDYNRMNLLIAVLEKRAGYFFGNLDVYVNIVGGIALRDTACDLAVCLSMVSSLLDRPVSDKLIAIGEVGLGGEVRSVHNLEQRLHEAERIGFERAVIPKHSLNHLNPADYPGMQLIGAAYITDAINALKSDRL